MAAIRGESMPPRIAAIVGHQFNFWCGLDVDQNCRLNFKTRIAFVKLNNNNKTDEFRLKIFCPFMRCVMILRNFIHCKPLLYRNL
jgi:hypothetical protein